MNIRTKRQATQTSRLCAVLMITASRQTFSGQFKHLTGQAKFGQSNILYIIKGKVIEFLIEKPMSG